MSVESSVSTESTDELTLEKVRNQLAELIERGFELSTTTLIDALPVSGKSYGVIKWAAETGKPLTVLAPRHDLLDEYETYCEEFGLDHWRIPSFLRDCESFEKNDNGEYKPIDSAAQELLKEYKQGFSGESLHSTHSGLSCQAEGECTFVAKRNQTPSKEEVLLGTYRLAQNKTWIKDRYVAFDEFPGGDFLKTFENGIGPIISAYVKDDRNELPFKDYLELVERKHTERESIEEWKGNEGPWFQDTQHAQQSPNPSAHTLAPLITLAPLEMDTLGNNWRYSDLGYGRVAVQNPKENEWTFLLPPDLSSAESVIGLDGTPNLRLWELALNEEVMPLHLLDDGERETYIQDLLGYQFVQTTENWKAVQSGEGASPPKDLALVEGISRKEEQKPALISSQKAIRQYNEQGLNKLTDTTEHYSNLKGMNKFGEERLGIVLGNPQPSDDEVEKWAALAGESAKRKSINGEKTTGKDTDFGQFGNRVMHTLTHDEVLQAAMRFGREETDGVRGATVYVHTSAVPPWLPVKKEIPSIHSWTRAKGGMQKTAEAITELNDWQNCEWKSTDLYPHLAELKRRTVRNCLDNLADEGYIKFEGKWGQGTPKHYTNICLEDAGRFGHLEFPE